jgi:hypothetical protein
MPLAGTGAALGDKIAAKITASDAPAAAKETIKALWESIGVEIVNHIVSNAQVSPGIALTAAGAAAAVPVTVTGATTGPGSLQ